MSTNDVPGANPANRDELAMGCWAEHDDGSLMVVSSTENDEVVYSMFDMSKVPPVEFRDKMPIDDFKKYYSWDGKNTKWTWHDKTPFPWDKVIKAGATDGVLPAVSAHDQLQSANSVARAIADKMHLPGHDVDQDQIDHMMGKESPRKMIQSIQDAVDSCPKGASKPGKKLQKLLKKQEKLQKKIEAEMAG